MDTQTANPGKRTTAAARFASCAIACAIAAGPIQRPTAVPCAAPSSACNACVKGAGTTLRRRRKGAGRQWMGIRADTATPATCGLGGEVNRHGENGRQMTGAKGVLLACAGRFFMVVLKACNLLYREGCINSVREKCEQGSLSRGGVLGHSYFRV